MEIAICLLFGWAVASTVAALCVNDMRKLDIEFLQDDVRRLRERQENAAKRHHKLKDALREAVTDEE